jgi:hypothetical protein
MALLDRAVESYAEAARTPAAGAAAPTGPAAASVSQSASPSPDAAPAAPGVQNNFNVTVHMQGGVETDQDELAERLARLLVEQARRYGIDV